MDKDFNVSMIMFKCHGFVDIENRKDMVSINIDYWDFSFTVEEAKAIVFQLGLAIKAAEKNR